MYHKTPDSSPDQIGKDFFSKPHTQILNVEKLTTTLPALHTENNTVDE
jgi:hypothetical protein